MSFDTKCEHIHIKHGLIKQLDFVQIPRIMARNIARLTNNQKE